MISILTARNRTLKPRPPPKFTNEDPHLRNHSRRGDHRGRGHQDPQAVRPHPDDVQHPQRPQRRAPFPKGDQRPHNRRRVEHYLPGPPAPEEGADPSQALRRADLAGLAYTAGHGDSPPRGAADGRGHRPDPDRPGPHSGRRIGAEGGAQAPPDPQPGLRQGMNTPASWPLQSPPNPIRTLQMLDPANSDELEAYP